MTKITTPFLLNIYIYYSIMEKCYKFSIGTVFAFIFYQREAGAMVENIGKVFKSILNFQKELFKKEISFLIPQTLHLWLSKGLLPEGKKSKDSPPLFV